MALWSILVPPIAGLVIGYFTNDLALKMLFRPYRAYKIGGWQVPFTPGLIPQNQPRLAKQISQTIMGSLLTPDELRNLARRLLETERMRSGIQWLLKIALDRLENPDKQDQTAQVLARILKDLFGESLPRLIRVLSRQEGWLEAPITQLFDQVLLELRFSDEQAREITTWILEQILPPRVLRQSLVDFLTDKNIDAIDEGFRERASGTYWVVANLFGAKNALLRLRAYCLEDPEGSEGLLDQLLRDVGVTRRLTEVIQNLSLQSLPVLAVRQLRKGLRTGIQDYIRIKGPDALAALGDSIDWEGVAQLVLRRLRGSKAVQDSIDQVSLDLALVLERYLDRDLESLMTQVIPVLNLDQVIIDRVNATSPENLEKNIQQIVKQELQAIVNLGGILGFVVGWIQVFLLTLTN
ncbi:MAG: DUF445 domain-containing protein [Cyanophyceae cyanobacterium]